MAKSWIANCRGGGDVPGDQGGEYVLQEWYDYEWQYVFRPKRADVAAEIARQAKNAALNDNIGYSMVVDREGMWNHAKASGYETQKISVRTNADCSSSTVACVKLAGYKLGVQALKDIPASMYTGNQKQLLEQSGQFETLTDRAHLKSGASLMTGDILLVRDAAGRHHTTIVYQGAMTEPTPIAVREGIYTIKTSIDSRYVLDVVGGGKKSGDNVWLYQDNGSKAQQFKLSKNSDKTYTITNIGSGLALDVEGGSRANGANIWQYAPNGSDAQKWIISADGNGFLFFNVAAKKCMDVKGAAARSATNVWSYERNGSSAQRWWLKPVEAPQGVEIEEGEYFIKSASNVRFCVDICGGSRKSGGNAWLWEHNGTKAQEFMFSRNEDGTYTITNVNSGLALDVLGGLSAEGTNVQQYKSNGTDAQKWIVVQNSNKTFGLYNVGAGKMLDIAGARIEAGTNIQTYRANGTVAQQWLLE